jgi:hypothetical protein
MPIDLPGDGEDVWLRHWRWFRRFSKMKSSVQKVKPSGEASVGNEIESTGSRDFVSLSKELGYIRARQLLKQVSVKRHQDKINLVDAKKMHEYRPARFNAAVHQSMTYGAPTMETEIVCHLLSDSSVSPFPAKN